MSTTIRRWGLAVPRLHWTWRRHAPLESMTVEELARAVPEWGRIEVRSYGKREPGNERAFTRDDMILMERMGRVR